MVLGTFGLPHFGCPSVFAEKYRTRQKPVCFRLPRGLSAAEKYMAILELSGK
jgi:hypothetical protein